MVSMRTSMRHFQIIGGLGAVVLACSALGVAQDVHYNFMPGTNFSNFHTFKWVGYIGRFEPVNQILAQENPGRNRWPTDGEGVSPRPTRSLSLAFRLPFSSRDSGMPGEVEDSVHLWLPDDRGLQGDVRVFQPEAGLSLVQRSLRES
jgi:hypothetical protein